MILFRNSKWTTYINCRFWMPVVLVSVFLICMRYFVWEDIQQSPRLAKATQAQLEQVEVSPSGYGLHWPALDEDLSVDGLIGVRHANPSIVAEA